MGLSVFFYIRGMKYLIGIVLIGLLASCKDDVCSCHHLDVKEKRIGEEKLTSEELDYLTECKKEFGRLLQDEELFSECGESKIIEGEELEINPVIK